MRERGRRGEGRGEVDRKRKEEGGKERERKGEKKREVSVQGGGNANKCRRASQRKANLTAA